MDAGILKTLGQIAGIGGLALGVALLLFHGLIRKVVFPKLTRADFRLLIILVWTIGVLGIAAAYGAVEWFNQAQPGDIPRSGAVALDLRILAAAFGATHPP